MTPSELLLLRHAKSSWDDPSMADFDRPLNKRGRRDAPRLGQEITRMGLVPDLVLCSSARRTRETFERLAPHLTTKPRRRFRETLYLADPNTIIDVVNAALQRHIAGRIMIIGHNPGIEALAAILADRAFSHGAGLRALTDKFPTAALAVFQLPKPESKGRSGFDLGDYQGRAPLRRFIRPRDMKGDAITPATNGSLHIRDFNDQTQGHDGAALGAATGGAPNEALKNGVDE